jgi:hypothetical protein
VRGRSQDLEFWSVIRGGGWVDQYSQTMPAEIHDGGSRYCPQAQQGSPRHIRAFLSFLIGHVSQVMTPKAPATVERQLRVSVQNPCWKLSWKVRSNGPIRLDHCETCSRLGRSFWWSFLCFPERFTVVHRFSQKRHTGIRTLFGFWAGCRLAVSTRASWLPKLFQSTQKQPASTSSASTNRSELM